MDGGRTNDKLTVSEAASMRDYTGVQRRKAFDGERKAGRTRGLLAGSVREKLLVVREKKFA